MEEQSEPPSKKLRVGDVETNTEPSQESQSGDRDFTEDVDVNPAGDSFMVDDDKCTDYVTAEELEKLREFQVLDEVKSDDEDSNDEASDSSDEVPEEEIEKMLEEGLPEHLKGAPKPKEKPYLIRQKVVLEEKGVNQFEVLPLDWMMVRHYSGMPVYVHRGTRVATLAKPYCLGKDNTKRHDIPISAIPCLAYRRALEEEAKQKEIDRQIDEQIKSGRWQQQANKNSQTPTEKKTDKNKTRCPYLHAKGIAQDSDKMPDNHEALKASVKDKDKRSEDATEENKTDIDAVENKSDDVAVKNSADFVQKETKDEKNSHEINKDLVEIQIEQVGGLITKDSKEGIIKKSDVKNESNVDKKDAKLHNEGYSLSNHHKGAILNSVINKQIEKLTEAIAEQESNLKENKTLTKTDEIVNQIENNRNNSSQKSNDENAPISIKEETALRNCTKPVDYASESTSQVKIDNQNNIPNVDNRDFNNDLQKQDGTSTSESLVTVSDVQNQARNSNAERRNNLKDVEENEELKSTSTSEVHKVGDITTNDEENPDQSSNIEKDTASDIQIQNNTSESIDSTSNVQNQDGSSNSDVPLNIQPVVLPGGIVMAPPRVESVSTSWKAQHLNHEQVNDYCKKLFKFKTVDVMHFKRWADRRKYMKARKALQYPPLPAGTKLITIPASASHNDTGGKPVKRDCVMNMNGRSYLSVFHEYVRRALQKQPVYKFKQLENAATPYQATVYIGGMQYGCGHGSSKRSAKSAAARASIRILIPEMQLDEPLLHTHIHTDPAEPDFSFFDNLSIEDPRITEFCAATCEPTPHAILRTCLLRNFGAGDKQIHTQMKKEFQKVELTMKVGKHTAVVVCKNKKSAKQRASQAILQMLHPQLHSWGSLLRLYGSRSVKSCKEKKLEEQQITLLQDEARRNEPNYAVLEKLKHEMRKLRARDEAVVPIGTMLLKDDLPTHSNSNLNNVDL